MKKTNVRVIELDEDYAGILINILVNLKNELESSEQDTFYVDNLLLMILNSPEKTRYYRKSNYLEER